MRKKNVIDQLVRRCPELPVTLVEKMSNEILKQLVATIRAGGRAEIRGFGTFFSRLRERRLLRNPRTGELVEVIPKRIPRFKAGVVLREKINRRSSSRAEK